MLGEAVAGGLGSAGKLQSSASTSIHFGLVPFSFLLRFPFPGKQQGGNPEGEKPTSLRAREHSEEGCDSRHHLSPQQDPRGPG